jgi:hypothetical protein
MAQGRCSAVLAVAVLLVSSAALAHGANYIVGDTTGWVVPASNPTFYADWAANKTFVAGDTLRFVYSAARHNVMKVTPSEYAACTTTSTNVVQTGNDTVVLVAGQNSYVCGIPTHCAGGQKLTVNATAAAGTPTNPITPPGPPSAPANAAVADTTVSVFQLVAAIAVAAFAF